MTPLSESIKNMIFRIGFHVYRDLIWIFVSVSFQVKSRIDTNTLEKTSIFDQHRQLSSNILL